MKSRCVASRVRSAQQRVSAGPVGVGGALDDYSRERGCDLIEGHGLIPVEAPLEARVVTAVPAGTAKLGETKTIFDGFCSVGMLATSS